MPLPSRGRPCRASVRARSVAPPDATRFPRTRRASCPCSLSSSSGSLLWIHNGSSVAAYLGLLISGIGDVDQDGNPDVGPDDCSGQLSFAYTQAWYRDPALPFNAFGLTNAIQFVVAP